MFDQIKYYTECVENSYPNLKDLIIGDLSTEDYVHIIQLASSVMLHRDEIRPGGGFVKAICENNLRDAVGRADSVAIKGLRFFVYCFNNLHPSHQNATV